MARCRGASPSRGAKRYHGYTDENEKEKNKVCKELDKLSNEDLIMYALSHIITRGCYGDDTTELGISLQLEKRIKKVLENLK